MKAARLFTCFAATSVLALAANAQQTAPNPAAAACGSTEANFTIKHQPASPVPAQAPTGKALVYIVETMEESGFATKKVNIGLDGQWLGATDAATHIVFTVDPGVHHLCAVYQGEAVPMDAEGHTLLLHLNAEAGKIYFFRYHAIFLKESPGLAFFEPVDEDEGTYLTQGTDIATSTLKK